EKISAAFFGESLIPQSEWSAIAAIGAAGKKTDRDQSERFVTLPGLAGAAQIDRYIEIFCTKTAGKRDNVFTSDIKRLHGKLCERLHQERDRVWRLIERRRAVAARDRTIALVTIAKAVLDRFRAEKDRRGLLDFEDQIDKTHELLARVSAAWVHYKLDRGIDHVLIDEAQDTSPKQWGIVRHLVAEFFAGKGASERKRTIFAVGDEKQSIFSFQGAAPAEFENMRREFETLSVRSNREFRHVRFDTSLRSGANVLSAVDIVFKPTEIAASLTQDSAGIPEHMALASAALGVVETWDTEKPLDDGGEKDPWNAPFDKLTGSKPAVRLAERIAKAARGLMEAGRRPGDIMVLVNRRGALFEAIIRALKNANVPVAGADRLVLTEHIAVMDLLALADALLLPQDDLALATALKIPLFGFDDDDIFALAYNRGKHSLRAALNQKSSGDNRFGQARARLDVLSARARIASPFAFYAQLLGAEHGRERFFARLGREASDALDEYLNLALEYERNEAPTLQGFVNWMRAAKSEIKRDMEMARDEVRVMTVHGAKGLEAPVVFLADTTTRPEGYHPPPLLSLPAQTGAAPLIWAKGEKEDVGPMINARLAARVQTRNEYRRLLYVAMTRAAEQLIVCGIEARKRPDGCWYDLVLQALHDQPGFREHEADGLKLWRYRKVEPAGTPEPVQEEPAPSANIAGWLKQPVAIESRMRVLAPSSGAEGRNRPRAPWSDASRTARRRGIIVHRLLQSLPEIPAAHRVKAMQNFLARQSGIDPTEQSLLGKQVMLVLEDSRFCDFFESGSRAEVPIVGRLRQGSKAELVSGQVDRMRVTDDAILIADFKNGQNRPERIEAYTRQLALYRAVLQEIYPRRAVRAALIWTEVPDLMELSSGAMDAALGHVTSM